MMTISTVTCPPNDALPAKGGYVWESPNRAGGCGCLDRVALFAVQREMAGYLKTTCKVKQMVTSGNEGTFVYFPP